jgi:hypothetical protein
LSAEQFKEEFYTSQRSRRALFFFFDTYVARGADILTKRLDLPLGAIVQ